EIPWIGLRENLRLVLTAILEHRQNGVFVVRHITQFEHGLSFRSSAMRARHLTRLHEAMLFSLTMGLKVRKVVIPAAGLGTRFLPATKAMPKEMLCVVDKPIIQYAVEEAVASGIEHVIIVTSRSKSSMEDHFDIAY